MILSILSLILTRPRGHPPTQLLRWLVPTPAHLLEVIFLIINKDLATSLVERRTFDYDAVALSDESEHHAAHSILMAIVGFDVKLYQY